MQNFCLLPFGPVFFLTSDLPSLPLAGMLEEKHHTWKSALILLRKFYFFIFFMLFFRYISGPLLWFESCESYCILYLAVCYPAKQLQDVKVEKSLNVLLDDLVQNSIGRVVQKLIGHPILIRSLLLDLQWPADPRFIKVKKWSRIYQYYSKFTITMVPSRSYVLPGKCLRISSHMSISLSQVYIAVALREGSSTYQN